MTKYRVNICADCRHMDPIFRGMYTRCNNPKNLIDEMVEAQFYIYGLEPNVKKRPLCSEINDHGQCQCWEEPIELDGKKEGK